MMAENNKARVCIVAHNSYGAMIGGKEGHIGGVERQTSMLAKWLIKNGLDVSMITWGQDNDCDEIINGVKIIKLCKKNEGIPGLKFIYPRWTSLIFALKRADADVYYNNLAEYVTGQVGLWCRLNSKRFIYSVASEPDCDRKLPKMNSYREKILYRIGLYLADKIIVQTKTQMQMLESNFSLKSTILPMPCPDFGEKIHDIDVIRNSNRVVWVGRISPVKRIEFLIEVAKKLPDIQFDVVGASNTDTGINKEYVAKIKRELENVKNINMLGTIERDEMPRVYKSASVLCCTSEYEGFPNTFLEAFSCGLPVLSTFDPGGLIKEHSLGAISYNVGGFTELLSKILTDNVLRNTFSLNARRYYLNNHTLDSAMNKIKDILIEKNTRQ